MAARKKDVSGPHQVMYILPLYLCPAPTLRSYFAIFGNLFGFKNFGKLVAADNIVNSLFGLLQVAACVNR